MERIVFSGPVSYTDFIVGVAQVTGLKETSIKSLAKVDRKTNEYVFQNNRFVAIAERSAALNTIRGKTPGRKEKLETRITKAGHKITAKKKTNGKEIVIKGYEHENTYPTRQAMIAFAKSIMQKPIRATNTKSTDDAIVITCAMKGN